MLDLMPSKIIAVHLSYRSRAAERGRVPAQPSYFLKAPSTLSGHDAPVRRPRGCQLLAFEGEIALVIGATARDVPPDEAWRHVGWVTAANDFGLYDLRYADPGSNVHSKGMDGYTPIGPELLAAADLDPGALRLRTWVTGQRAQHARADDLLFGFELMIADLSRVMTLCEGDIILTGTPTGSSVVVPGDVVEVEVDAGPALRTGRLRNHVVESDRELGPWGAMPAVTDDTLRAAFGTAPVPDTDLALALDKLRIFELVQRERLWRDLGEWDKLAEAYTDDAVIRTSWFHGDARDFAEGSKLMAERGRHSKHPIWPVYALVNGDRALVESRAQIQNRSEIDGVAVDTIQYVRFFSRVRRTPAGWRLASFEGIYEKGTIAPVNPADAVPIDWAEVASATPRSSYQLHAWAITRRGYSVGDDLLGDDRPQQLREFHAAAHRWLLGGG